MSKIYFTLTGTNHYFGKEFLKKGTKIRLEKEPDNEYDKEAIKVTYEGLGKIGYVANSSYTVLGDSMSAGRIYDKIGKKAKVVLVTDHGTICSISKKIDFNRDGKLDSWERAAQFQFMDEMMKNDEKSIFDDDDEIDTFSDAGLDYDELEFMDP